MQEGIIVAVEPLPPQRPTARFMLAHPAHLFALGFGSGLARTAPGTVGTAWAWLAYLVLQHWIGAARMGIVVALSLPLGWWACTVTARHLLIDDPSAIVRDEIACFWLVLWLWLPGGFVAQAVAFGLFRLFDALKPGPVGWADRAFKGGGWRGGFGIMVDDLVAAFCTLLVLAFWKRFT